MGLTPHEYYCMSPLEFHLAAKGYANKMAQQWHHTRWLSYHTVMTIPSKKKLPPMHKWMPLPNDSAKISDDRIKGMFDKLKNNPKWQKTS